MRTWLRRSIAVLLLLLPCACRGSEHTPGGRLVEDFEGRPGAPAGFRVCSGRWEVRADDSAYSGRQVLAQSALGAQPDFNLLLAERAAPAALLLYVRLRPRAGEIDQGGGLVWRAQDQRNYYLARWNPLEQNLRVYKVVDGERTQLASAPAPAAGGWRLLSVTMRGERWTCELDGLARLGDADGTFRDGGHVGLWTKADAQTEFDDLGCLALP